MTRNTRSRARVDWLRLAAFERDWFLVDIAVIMSFGVWVPDGYRPLWLPLIFASGAVLFTFAGNLAFRAVDSLIARLPKRVPDSCARIGGDIAWPEVTGESTSLALEQDPPPTTRDYLGNGTTIILLAIALLLAVIGMVHGPRVLANLALPIVAYAALSRAALLACFAQRGAGTA